MGIGARQGRPHFQFSPFHFSALFRLPRASRNYFFNNGFKSIEIRWRLEIFCALIEEYYGYCSLAPHVYSLHRLTLRNDKLSL